MVHGRRVRQDLLVPRRGRQDAEVGLCRGRHKATVSETRDEDGGLSDPGVGPGRGKKRGWSVGSRPAKNEGEDVQEVVSPEVRECARHGVGSIEKGVSEDRPAEALLLVMAMVQVNIPRRDRFRIPKNGPAGDGPRAAGSGTYMRKGGRVEWCSSNLDGMAKRMGRGSAGSVWLHGWSEVWLSSTRAPSGLRGTAHSSFSSPILPPLPAKDAPPRASFLPCSDATQRNAGLGPRTPVTRSCLSANSFFCTLFSSLLSAAVPRGTAAEAVAEAERGTCSVSFPPKTTSPSSAAWPCPLALLA